MFLNSPVKVFSAISNSSLTSVGNELYENGVRIATQTDIDTLQQEIDNIPGGNPNSLITDQPLITPEQGAIVYFDGTNSFNTTSTNNFKFDSVNGYILINDTIQPTRSEIVFIQDEINAIEGQISGINSSVLGLSQRTDNLEATTASQQTAIDDLGISVNTNTNNINALGVTVNSQGSTINDLGAAINSLNSTTISQQSQINTLNQNVLDLQEEDGLLQTQITNLASDIATNTSNIIQLQTQTTSLQTYANSAMLRAINCTNWTPTTVYNIVWSNLSAQEKLEWKGLDPTTIDPIQSATGNYWNFSKSLVNTNKIGWYIPVDLSGLTFQDLESFWAVIRFNTTTNITTEGSIYFQITTSPATPPNTFRTRINYSNPGTVMNQTGYFYKIYALDTITTTTATNLGKAQETNQQKFKLNPMNVRSDLWSIGFNKLVASPTGDVSAGFTSAPIQSISLQTASNINTFNFDVVSIGYLDKQYNLFYA
jgi:uncharacterized coiled-coil protein SlyX